MNNLQARLLGHSSRFLRPGETIHSCAEGVREPSAVHRLLPLIYALYVKHYYVVATNYRLMVWVEALQGEPLSWEHDEIAGLVCRRGLPSYYYSRRKWKTVHAVRISLTLLGAPPFEIDFPQQLERLPSQQELVFNYLPWLQQAAASGLVTAQGQARAAERFRQSARA